MPETAKNAPAKSRQMKKKTVREAKEKKYMRACMCVRACVCVREREKERARDHKEMGKDLIFSTETRASCTVVTFTVSHSP